MLAVVPPAHTNILLIADASVRFDLGESPFASVFVSGCVRLRPLQTVCSGQLEKASGGKWACALGCVRLGPFQILGASVTVRSNGR